MFSSQIIGDNEIVNHFKVMPDRFRNELKQGISRLTIKLQTNVKQDRLSGQALGVRTGRGRRSIQQIVVNEGERVAGIVSTAVDYMIGWETGWEGPSPKAGLTKAKAAFSLAGSAAQFANGTARKRAFLVPALADLQKSGDIDREMDAAAARAVA